MNSVQAPHLHPLINPTDLATIRSSVTLLDVRSPGEFESSHIPGSYNVPLDLLPEDGPDLESEIAGPVVLVCRSGMRARQAEQALAATGFPRLHVLEGGLSAWESASLPVNRGQARWDMERQGLLLQRDL